MPKEDAYIGEPSSNGSQILKFADESC